MLKICAGACSKDGGSGRTQEVRTPETRQQHGHFYQDLYTTETVINRAGQQEEVQDTYNDTIGQHKS